MNPKNLELNCTLCLSRYLKCFYSKSASKIYDREPDKLHRSIKKNWLLIFQPSFKILAFQLFDRRNWNDVENFGTELKIQEKQHF